MKKFITNNWKKIVIIIGVVIILISMTLKIASEKTLLQDYIKYGKNIESTGNISGKITGALDQSNGVVSEEMVKYAIIFTVAILFVVFITSIGSGSSSDKAKKK